MASGRLKSRPSTLSSGGPGRITARGGSAWRSSVESGRFSASTVISSSSCGEVWRDISAILRRDRRGKRRVSRERLLIDVGELASRIFQEELALNHIDGSEDVYKQDGRTGEQHGAVLMKEEVPVGNEEAQLAHEPETRGQKDGNGDDERVGNHGRLLAGSDGQRIKQ